MALSRDIAREWAAIDFWWRQGGAGQSRMDSAMSDNILRFPIAPADETVVTGTDTDGDRNDDVTVADHDRNGIPDGSVRPFLRAAA